MMQQQTQSFSFDNGVAMELCKKKIVGFNLFPCFIFHLMTAIKVQCVVAKTEAT